MTQIHWLNDLSGSFTNPANWSGGLVPRSADDAILDPAGVTPFTVGLAANAEVNSIQTAADATLAINGKLFRAVNGTGAGANAGTIAVGDHSVFRVNGTFDNSGRVDLHNMMTTGPDLGSLTLTGGGVVTEYSRNGVETHGRVEGGDLTNVNNTIIGGAGIGGTEGLYLRMAGVLTNEVGGSLINQDAGRRTQTGEIRASTIINDGTIASSGYDLQIETTSLVNSGEILLHPWQNASFMNIIGQYFGNSGMTVFDGTGGIVLVNSLGNTGTIMNLGSSFLNVDFGQGTPAYNIMNAGVVLQAGSGSIDFGSSRTLGSISNTGTISASSGLITIYGGGQADRLTSNAGSIEASGGGSILLADGLVNTGTVGVDGGTVTIYGTLSGSGSVDIAGGVLQVDFTSVNISFIGGAGELISYSQDFTGSISGFSTSGGTKLDLVDIGFTGSREASYSGTASQGVLTVTDGAHTAHITLIGDYLNATFNAANDGRGGTLITASSSHAAFVAAAASLTDGSGEAVRAVLAPQSGAHPLVLLATH